MSEAPNRTESKLDDGLGDWRFRAIHKVPSGERLRVISALGELQAPTGESFEFTDFMAVALYLNVAISANEKANELRERLKPEELVSRAGPHKRLADENLTALFDFIEQSAIATIFSFQALEAYSNFVIHFYLADGERYLFACPGKAKMQLEADEIERCGATLDKLKSIVPHLLKVRPPTKEPFWSRVWDMKRVRDALIHLKYKDQFGAATTAASSNSSTRADPDFVFYKLVSGEIRELPLTAVETIDYFTKVSGTPRWLLYPLSVYGMAPTPPKGTTRITISPPL